MPLDEPKTRCETAGLICFGYTSPSHRTGAPRWRLAGPFSREIPPAEYPRMIARINGLLGGVLAPESGKITQAMFIGRVDGADFDSFIGDGDECLDEIAELDIRAIPLRGQNRHGKTTKGGKPDLKSLTDDELKEEIISGRAPFHASGQLLYRLALEELPKSDAQAELEAVFDSIPVADRGRKWQAHRAAIPNWVDRMYIRAAKHLGTFLARLVTYFEEDALWRGAIRFNQFSQVIEAATPFPPMPAQVFEAYGPLREVDMLEALLIAQANGFPKLGTSELWRAVTLAAEHQGYHPVRNYFAELPAGNGGGCVEQLFLSYFPGSLPEPQDPKAPTQEENEERADMVRYLKAIAKGVAIAAVKRIFEPGCKVDTVVVLIGEQGIGKSRGLAALVPDRAWFSDDLSPNLIDKDTKDSLLGIWLFELAEIPQIRKEADRVKGFMSRQVDRFRRAYERTTSDQPRQCIFIGTSNDVEFTDPTGSRRFLPVPLKGSVDVAAIVRDRDLFWSEALDLYREGHEWWLSPEIEKIAVKLQAAYAEADSWVGLAAEWLTQKFPPDAQGNQQIEPFTVREILEDWGYAFTPGRTRSALGIPIDKPVIATKGDEMRLARCLKQLGYRRDPHRQRRNGRRDCLWTRARA